MKLHRCAWAESDPLLAAYHDKEWGVPEYDSRALWEKLMLDGFQAGLSWLVVLRKRDALRNAFAGFVPERVALFNDDDVARLLTDSGIIRSRAKIVAAIGGARAYLSMHNAGENFASFVWDMAGGRPLQAGQTIVTRSQVSEDISKALKARGFKFVGPVIVYAWMQAVGMVNDHSPDCFRRPAIREMGRNRPSP